MRSVQEGLFVDFKLVALVPDHSSSSRWCLTHTDPQGVERKIIYYAQSEALLLALDLSFLKGQKLKGESEMKWGGMTFFSILCQVPSESWGCTKQPFSGSFLDIFLKSLGVFCLVNKASIDPPVCMTFWS